MKKDINKKYAELLIRAQNATKRNEAIFLIKKAKNYNLNLLWQYNLKVFVNVDSFIK